MICERCARGADLATVLTTGIFSEPSEFMQARVKDFHEQCQEPVSCTCQHRLPWVLTEDVQPG